MLLNTLKILLQHQGQSGNVKMILLICIFRDSNSKGKKRKRKNESEDEEEDYEKHARSFQEDKKQEDMKMMLPVINKGKVIKRMMKAEDNLPLSNGNLQFKQVILLSQ